MKVSAQDLNRLKALHVLLEEANVGRAAQRLRITPAAASNALRRLREEFADPLLFRQGRGLVRTRLGEELRAPARDVVAAAERLVEIARPFTANAFAGSLPIALAEHVAAWLLPALDGLAGERAPRATLAISAIPLEVSDWLEQSGGVLVGPAGAFAAVTAGDRLSAEAFYEDRYVCVMRRGHPAETRRWSAATYAGQDHVVVLPRGRTPHSDVDEQLQARGLSRHVSRLVPSFSLALSLVETTDLITTMPARCVPQVPLDRVTIREVPLRLRPLAMRIVTHPAHEGDGRTRFIKELLRAALKVQSG